MYGKAADREAVFVEYLAHDTVFTAPSHLVTSSSEHGGMETQVKSFVQGHTAALVRSRTEILTLIRLEKSAP